MTQQVEEMTNLLRFLFCCRVPGEFLLESESVDDDSFLLTKLADSFGAVAITETAVLTTAHGRVGDDEAY